MEILIDVNLSSKWIPYFQQYELYSVHWLELGNCDALDSEIFDYAIENNFTVFTHDLDFGTILSKQKSSSPSVIQLRTNDTLPNRVGEKVVSAIKRFYSELETGCILTIDVKKDKVRLLPI